MARPRTLYIEASTRVDGHRYVVGRDPRGAWYLYTSWGREPADLVPLIVDERHARFFAKSGRGKIGVNGIKALARLSRKVLGPAPEA